MVTGWSAPRGPRADQPGGRSTLDPAAVVLATGCRERPRSARLVPGSRPAGVMTTGMLQQLVYVSDLPAGRRALVVGAEHVSFSAIATLAHGRRAHRRADHRAAAPPVGGRLPARRARPLPGAGLDAHARQRDPRPPARRGGGADRPRRRRYAHGRLRHRRLHRRLDPGPRAGRDGGPGARRRHARPSGRRRAAHARRRACSPPATCCTGPSRPTSPRSTAATPRAAWPATWTTASGRRAACRWSARSRSAGSRRTRSRCPRRASARALRAARERVPARAPDRDRSGRPRALERPGRARDAGALGAAAARVDARRSTPGGGRAVFVRRRPG